ncbi:hypothetical protein DdX_18731 [Ditylenchus destructor]|uniref:Ubiquitin-like domain-containing protein n=1 Tax=Ditylenchus destructor TaxID=166010 RepID=A0AAD4MPH4_9BILA|nr:hypothetical protein DdX_18731 [Ditylenchus destructor]
MDILNKILDKAESSNAPKSESGESVDVLVKSEPMESTDSLETKKNGDVTVSRASDHKNSPLFSTGQVKEEISEIDDLFEDTRNAAKHDQNQSQLQIKSGSVNTEVQTYNLQRNRSSYASSNSAESSGGLTDDAQRPYFITIIPGWLEDKSAQCEVKSDSTIGQLWSAVANQVGVHKKYLQLKREGSSLLLNDDAMTLADDGLVAGSRITVDFLMRLPAFTPLSLLSNTADVQNKHVDNSAPRTTGESDDERRRRIYREDKRRQRARKLQQKTLQETKASNRPVAPQPSSQNGESSGSSSLLMSNAQIGGTDDETRRRIYREDKRRQLLRRAEQQKHLMSKSASVDPHIYLLQSRESDVRSMPNLNMPNLESAETEDERLRRLYREEKHRQRIRKATQEQQYWSNKQSLLQRQQLILHQQMLVQKQQSERMQQKSQLEQIPPQDHEEGEIEVMEQIMEPERKKPKILKRNTRTHDHIFFYSRFYSHSTLVIRFVRRMAFIPIAAGWAAFWKGVFGTAVVVGAGIAASRCNNEAGRVAGELAEATMNFSQRGDNRKTCYDCTLPAMKFCKKCGRCRECCKPGFQRCDKRGDNPKDKNKK